MFRRVIATTAAALTLCGLAAIPALPAHATPEDGEGCIGLPDVPTAYVCVVSLTPTAVVPTVTTSSIPVTVPRFCYVAGCTSATTVNVPVPGATPSTGNVAVIWYRGTSYPIGFGTGPVVQAIVDGVAAEGSELAGDAVGLATGLAGTVLSYAGTTVNGLAQYAVTTVNNTVTTVNGAVATANGLVATVSQIVLAQVQAVVDTVPTQGELQAAVDAAVVQARAIAAGASATATAFIRDNVTEPLLEIWEPIRDEINDFDPDEHVRERLERLQPTFDRIGEVLYDVIETLPL